MPIVRTWSPSIIKWRDSFISDIKSALCIHHRKHLWRKKRKSILKTDRLAVLPASAFCLHAKQSTTGSIKQSRLKIQGLDPREGSGGGIMTWGVALLYLRASFQIHQPSCIGRFWNEWRSRWMIHCSASPFCLKRSSHVNVTSRLILSESPRS